MRLSLIYSTALLLGLLACNVCAAISGPESHSSSDSNQSRHTNNWAVLVSTSRFWFNYRHMANVLSFYRTVKRLGIPDSQIILMLSDDMACNPRNLFPGVVYNDDKRSIDLYGDNIEVDFRGYEVTVENFIRLLTDRWDEDTPRSKRLLTDDRSNIFIYMTGHGGNEFLKFQDAEEIGSYDIADALAQMYEKKRYNEIFFMIDTCQANTMYSRFYSPNIVAVGSSQKDESSYSYFSDPDIGCAVIDRFTYYNLELLENIEKNSSMTLEEFFSLYNYESIHSHPGVRTDLFNRDLSQVKMTDFIGNVQRVLVDEVETDILEILSSANSTESESVDQGRSVSARPIAASTEDSLTAENSSSESFTALARNSVERIDAVIAQGLQELQKAVAQSLEGDGKAVGGIPVPMDALRYLQTCSMADMSKTVGATAVGVFFVMFGLSLL